VVFDSSIFRVETAPEEVQAAYMEDMKNVLLRSERYKLITLPEVRDAIVGQSSEFMQRLAREIRKEPRFDLPDAEIMEKIFLKGMSARPYYRSGSNGVFYKELIRYLSPLTKDIATEETLLEIKLCALAFCVSRNNATAFATANRKLSAFLQSQVEESFKRSFPVDIKKLDIYTFYSKGACFYSHRTNQPA
jgi:hypothetical protein